MFKNIAALTASICVILIMLGFACIAGYAFMHRQAEDAFPVVVRATYEPQGGGDLPDVEETLVRQRDAQTLVEQTIRNPLRRPEGVEVCPLQQRELALRIADDPAHNVSTVRECELVWNNERFFDLEQARYRQYAEQTAREAE